MVAASIDIGSSVKQRLYGFSFAYAAYQNVTVQSANPDLVKEFTQEESHIRKSFDLESLRLDLGVIESRRGFKVLGLDPARYRPSQEALLRRIIKCESLYQINTGVDVCNLLSIRFRMPMGLYDAYKIEGQLQLKIGTAEDVYMALNGREVQCDDKLILCDERGIVGSPYVDSERTGVTSQTKNFLHVIYFCHKEIKENDFKQMENTILKYNMGQYVHDYNVIKI